MTKRKGKYDYRQGYECPICQHLASRQADLKKHLMRVHGLSKEEALEKQRGAELAIEESTSTRTYPRRPDRYSKNAPGGE
jgi:uncharacterized C2H2 Zn-finger protein